MQVRLSSNESPFGPSPAVVDVLTAHAGDANRYPDDQSAELRAVIARHEGLGVEQVAVGNGSAALLMDLIAHEARRTDRGSNAGSVLAYDRAFIVYRLGAQVAGARFDEAPLGDGFARTPDALIDRLRPDTRIVTIDNPANPTGAHLDGDQLRAVIDAVPADVTVVVDEAYHQFARADRGYVPVADLDVDHPRLVTLRTFSKAYALAGLRVGYLLGSRDLVAAVDTARVRFNVNALAQAAAVAALGDDGHVQRTVAGTVAGRRRLAAGLTELEIPFVDGLGNFVLVDLGEPAGPVVAAYADHGVGVRTLAPYRLDHHIRVTVGTPHELDVFLDVSREVLADVASRRR